MAWIIVERGDWAKLCYAQGDVMTFASREAATAHAEAFSAKNPGVYFVESLYAPGYESLHRLCVCHTDALKARSVKVPM